MLKSEEMRYYLGQCFWTGISIAYWSGLIGPTVVRSLPNASVNAQLSASLYAISMLGVGEMVGGLLMGQVVDKLGSRIGVIINVLTIIFACSVTFWEIASNKYSWVTFLYTFAWGFSDGAINTHSNQMMGFEFETSSDPFSIFNSVQAVAIFSFMMLQSLLDTQNSRDLNIYTGIVMLLGILMCGATFFFRFKFNRVQCTGFK